MTSKLDLSDIFSYDQNFQSIMQNMLQTALDQSFQGVMITSAEPGYPIIYVNEALCELTGYSVDELLGKSPALLQGEKSDPTVLGELRDKLEKGEIFHGKTFNYRKDGSEFIMEWKIVPIHGVEGVASHYLAIQRELTDDNLTDGSLDTKLPFIHD
jgi:PAS domain S-box-containing protein